MTVLPGAMTLAEQELALLEELEGLKSKLAAVRGKGVTAYLHDPVGFVNNCVKFKPGHGLTAYQAEILSILQHDKRIAVRGPRGLGKSGVASFAILWFAITRDAAGRDWKIGTTAGSWSQLTDYLWVEIGKWANVLDWEKVGRPPFSARSEMMKSQMRLRHGLAIAASPDKPEKIEGLHADDVLFILDEAKIIPPEIFDSIEGSFSGAGEGSDLEAYALAISTPGEPAGRFYDIHTRKPGLEDWKVRHVTLDEAVRAGRMTYEWAERRKTLWGENSALYQNHVLGEFCTEDEEAVIPLKWVEAAFERWRQWEREGKPGQEGLVTVGVDVATSGLDRTVAAVRHGHIITQLATWAKADTMETTGRVKGIMEVEPGATAIVDAIGVGSGVFDRLWEQGVKAEGFVAGRKTGQKDKTGQFGFYNWRSYGWWNLRQLLEMPGSQVALPPDDELAGDLTALHYWHTSDAKLRVEEKKEVKKRIGRSTDRGDAVMQAFWLSGGSWADAYGTTTCPSEKCGRPFMKEANGKPRTECPFCKTPLDEPESEAA